MSEPKYEVWRADLNSLYDPEPHPPVFFEDCFTLEEARKSVEELRKDGRDAAWFVDKDTGDIID